jgi:hypothetical protein
MIRDAVEEESIKLARHVHHDELSHAGVGSGSGLKEVRELRKGGFEVGIEKLGAARGQNREEGKTRRARRTRRRVQNDPWFWLRSQRIKCMNCGYVRDTRHEGEELLMLNVPPVVRRSHPLSLSPLDRAILGGTDEPEFA